MWKWISLVMMSDCRRRYHQMVSERSDTNVFARHPAFQIAVTASSFTSKLTSDGNKLVSISPLSIRLRQKAYPKPHYLTPVTAMSLPTNYSHDQQQPPTQQHSSGSILTIERPASSVDLNVVAAAHNQCNDEPERFSQRSAIIAIAISIIASLGLCCALGSTITLLTTSKTRSAVMRALKTAFQRRRKLFVHITGGLQQLIVAATLFISVTVMSIKLRRGGRINPDFSYIEANPSTFWDGCINRMILALSKLALSDQDCCQHSRPIIDMLQFLSPFHESSESEVTESNNQMQHCQCVLHWRWESQSVLSTIHLRTYQ